MKESSISLNTQLPSRVCQNCGNKYVGEYCPSCGQQYFEGRFTVKESIAWIFDKLFNIEKGFYITVKDLVFNTNEMLTKYLNKATIGYMHPFRFAFFMATLSAILTVYSGTFESSTILQFSDGFADGWNNYESPTGRDSIKMLRAVEVLETLKKYFSFILLFNIPLYALASFFIYYRRRYNFTEHLILNCYALGLSLLLGVPLYLFMLADEGLIIYSVINPLITYLTFAFIYHKFFKENFFFSLLKTILVYLFLIVVIVIVVLIGTVLQQSLAG